MLITLLWRANEEPSSAPGSVVSGWTISNPASFRFLVGLLDAVADGDGDHRVVRSGGIAVDELNDGPAVGRLEAGNPAHVEPLGAQSEVVHVEVPGLRQYLGRT